MAIFLGFNVDVCEIRSEDAVFGHGGRATQVEIEFTVERPVASLWPSDVHPHEGITSRDTELSGSDARNAGNTVERYIAWHQPVGVVGGTGNEEAIGTQAAHPRPSPSFRSWAGWPCEVTVAGNVNDVESIGAGQRLSISLSVEPLSTRDALGASSVAAVPRVNLITSPRPRLMLHGDSPCSAGKEIVTLDVSDRSDSSRERSGSARKAGAPCVSECPSP